MLFGGGGEGGGGSDGIIKGKVVGLVVGMIILRSCQLELNWPLIVVSL